MKQVVIVKHSGKKKANLIVRLQIRADGGVESGSLSADFHIHIRLMITFIAILLAFFFFFFLHFMTLLF